MECLVMCQRYRRGFTTAEKTELWDRWQRGESLKEIGRAFGKPSSSIRLQVSPHGGIRPAPRRRSRLSLTLSEREESSRGLAAHQSARSMARLLGRSASTVSRELGRNGGYDCYRAALADAKAWDRARRPKRCKLANSARLRQAVASQLRLNWSPEQIAGWLKRAHAAFSATPQCGIEAFDEGMTVDWLAKEGDGAGRLCALANSLFGEGGNENDRHVRTAYGQLALQFQPTHSLHLHVRDQARGVMQPRRG